MRVAVCQMRSGDDVGANVAEAERLLAEAGDRGADLAVLPELFAYLGPSSKLSEIAEPVPGGRVTDALAAAAREHGMWVLGGSVHERDGERVHNTAPLFDRAGDLVARYRKIHLFDVRLDDQPPFRESAIFTAGTEIVTHPVEDVRAGLAICYDLRFPELFRILALRGARIVAVPSAFTLATGRDHWEVLLRARAIEDQVFVLAPNQSGEAPPHHSSFGRSMIVDPWGVVLATAPDGECFVAELDFATQDRVRESLPSLANRRPQAYLWPQPAEAGS
jgi:deaminated glutathione amidase